MLIRPRHANASLSGSTEPMSLFDLHSTTVRDESRGAGLPTVEKDSVRPGTEEDKPGDSLTVTEWAEQMAPFFHAASQIAPGFVGGARP